MTIAVTGANGQLGRELCQLLGDRAIPLTRAECDLENGQQLRGVFQQLKPEAIVNCAAYTQVDRAESEPALCMRINAAAVQVLAEVANQQDIPLLQVSTDYVFGADQDRMSPYGELDQVGPLGVYAQSKWEGEQHALQARRHFVVRTCGLYSPCEASPQRGRNFVDTMLSLAQERKELAIVNDQHCTPTPVSDVARAIAFLLNTTAYGTYHVTSLGETTWYEFAAELFRQAEIQISLRTQTTADYGAPAPRPRYSVLSSAKYQSLGGPSLKPWQEGIADYLAQVSVVAR